MFAANKTVTPFALARGPFTIRAENVSETAQKEFIELITSHAAQYDVSFMSVSARFVGGWGFNPPPTPSGASQPPNFHCPPIVCSHILFFPRSCYAPASLPIFQQHRYTLVKHTSKLVGCQI